MSDIVFSIARDFSVNPGPRYKRQGKFSGEELRPRLIELLDSAKGKIVVILDGTKGMGSSFLDEAFGGLIAKEGRERSELERRFEFVSNLDPSYILTIRDSFARARPTARSGAN